MFKKSGNMVARSTPLSAQKECGFMRFGVFHSLTQTETIRIHVLSYISFLWRKISFEWYKFWIARLQVCFFNPKCKYSLFNIVNVLILHHPQSDIEGRTRLSNFTFTLMHWRKKWQPTLVFLPGESQGQGSLVGCHMGLHRVRHDWSDLAAAVYNVYFVSSTRM